MKPLQPRLLILVSLFAIFTAVAQENDANAKKKSEKDLAALQGEWVMVSGSADGQSMPEEMLKQMKRVCKGDELTVTMAGEVFFKAKITIDPSHKPKTIDYEMIEGPTKGKRQLGIYELDGDTFKACFGPAGGERPAEFSSKSGERRTLSVWKRHKETKEPVPKS